jgi:hypothetical protein
MNIFIIYNIIHHVFFFNCTKCGFELVSQKMFEMKIKKMTHLIHLVIFHLKMIVCQNVNLPHTYGHRPSKHPFVT